MEYRVRHTLAVVAMAAAALWAPSDASARRAGPGPRGGGGAPRVQLEHGFTPDPFIINGLAGGPVAGRTMGPQCRGHYNGTPSLVVRTRGGFSRLRFVVSAQRDTTLAVVLPGGRVICDDDGGGNMNPLVVTGVPSGRVRVYVGSFHQGQATPFVLGVSELNGVTASTLGGPGRPPRPTPQPQPQPMPPAPQPGGVNPNGPPAFAGAHIQPGFMPDPVVIDGSSGGPIQASRVHSQCRGWITRRPSHVIHAGGRFNRLRLVVSSRSDTTLVVMLPNGQIVCDDDGGLRSNPQLSFATPRGPIRVWVGSYTSTGHARYQIGVTERPGINADNLHGGGQVQPQPGPGPRPPRPGHDRLRPNQVAIFGEVVLQNGFAPDPVIVQGQAGGQLSGMQIANRCSGNYTARPSHILRSNTGFRNIRFVVASQVDTTLMVMLPSGQVLCDDDGGIDRNPLIATASGPGAIRVWVGTFGGGRVGAPYRLGFTEYNRIDANQIGGRPNPPTVVTPQPAPPMNGPQTGPAGQFAPQQQTATMLPVGQRFRLHNGGRGPGVVGLFRPNRRRPVEVRVQSRTIMVGGYQVAPLPQLQRPVVDVTLRPDGTLVFIVQGANGAVVDMVVRWERGRPIVVRPWSGRRRGRR